MYIRLENRYLKGSKTKTEQDIGAFIFRGNLFFELHDISRGISIYSNIYIYIVTRAWKKNLATTSNLVSRKQTS